MEKIWAALANELADASADAGKSIVGIHGGRQFSSGIVIGKDAVAAANHAVRRDEEITVVIAPGKTIGARVAGRDVGSDLAVLRLEQAIDATPPRWGTTTSLRVGELVLALARTRRGNVVASSGIISGLINGPMRTWRGGEIDQFIRPDLTLYHGFSGGPLVNSRGEFLGMNTAGLHRSGITVPASTVASVAGELLEKGRVERPYLGLGMQTVQVQESLRARLNLKASDGLLLVHVEPASPAEKSGLLLGDLLLTLGGEPVTDTDSVQETLRAAKIGEQLEAGILRGGALNTIKVQLEARPRG
jgi:S1-C subfamily serine protease